MVYWAINIRRNSNNFSYLHESERLYESPLWDSNLLMHEIGDTDEEPSNNLTKIRSE